MGIVPEALRHDAHCTSHVLLVIDRNHRGVTLPNETSMAETADAGVNRPLEHADCVLRIDEAQKSLFVTERARVPLANNLHETERAHVRLSMLRSQYGEKAYAKHVGDYLDYLGASTEEQLGALLAQPYDDVRPSPHAQANREPEGAPWPELLAEWLAGVRYDTPDPDDNYVAAVAAPFDQALERIMRREIAHRAEHAPQKLSDVASSAFLTFLAAHPLENIGHSIAQTMILELNVAQVEERLTGNTQTEQIRDFVRICRSLDFQVQLFSEYSTLARMLVLMTTREVRFRLELLDRLMADAERIRQELDLSPDDRVDSVTFNQGDKHNGGRTVCVLRTVGQRRFVYKPHALNIDVHFGEVAARVSQHLRHPILTPKTVNCDSHGWQEFIDHKSCKGRFDFRRYYYSTGTLLALAYALGTTDLHFENIIACGPDPVIVDLETIFHAEVQTVEEKSNPREKPTAFSVLSTGLLSSPDSRGGEDTIDFGGIADSKGVRSRFRTPIVDDSQPGMPRINYASVVLPGASNVPHIAGRPADWVEFEDSLVEGFEACYRTLWSLGSALTGEDGLLRGFLGDRLRVVLRATNTYGQFIQTSLHPDYLRDALEAERLYGYLWQFPVISDPRVRFSELQQIRTHDVPLFTMELGERQVKDVFGTTVAEVEYDPISRAEDRLNAFSEDDLYRQLWTIRATFVTREIGQEAVFANSRARVNALPITGLQEAGRDSAEGPADSELLLVADSLTNQLLKLSVSGEDEGWLSLTAVDEKYWRVLPIGLNLYSGLAGISFAMHHLGRATNSTRALRAARRAGDAVASGLDRLVEEIRDVSADTTGPDPTDDVGLFGGIGGGLYALSHAMAVDTELDYSETIARVLELLHGRSTPAQALDVISGSAGLLEALRSVRAVLGRSDTLEELAAQHVAHLLRGAQAPHTGELAWQMDSIDAAPLAGYSHGASGILLALARSRELVQRADIDSSVQAALRFERRLRAEKGHWPDVRAQQMPGRGHGLTAWCHGAPGIALARGELLQTNSALDAVITADLHSAALETLSALEDPQDPGFLSAHCLCHGRLGNLEAFYSLQSGMLEPAIAHRVCAVQHAVLDDIATNGPASGVPGGLETPGYMTGLSGIALGVLRMSQRYRAEVPSALSADVPSGKAHGEKVPR